MDEPLFKCRVEELTFLGHLVLETLNRDLTDFVALSPDYSGPFTSNFRIRITGVEELIAPVKLTGELKTITRQLDTHFTHTRNLVNKLERFVEKADADGLKLTMNPVDFGFKAVRAEVYSKNDEGVVKTLRILKTNLTDNLSVLEGKGYNEAVQTELDSLINDFANDSIQQTLKKKEREALVKSNIGEFNKLWLQIDDILKSGKTIYKEKDKSKVKDYTYTELIKTVQLKRKKAEEDSAAPQS